MVDLDNGRGSLDCEYSWEREPEQGVIPPVDICRVSGRSPALIRFSSKRGGVWTGRFWGDGERGLEQVMPWPDPNQCCVVTGGIAYVGDVREPSSWQELSVYPVQGFVVFEERRIVALYDRWRVYAYGIDGKVWESADLASNGFELAGCSSDSLTVKVERDRDDVVLVQISAADGSIGAA